MRTCLLVCALALAAAGIPLGTLASQRPAAPPTDAAVRNRAPLMGLPFMKGTCGAVVISMMP